MGLVISEGSFKTAKPVDYLICLTKEGLKIFYVVQTVQVLRAIVYGMVGANKIRCCFFSKTAFVHICTITYSATATAYLNCPSLVNV